ncbi:MFS transporter [uncultured Ferrovibrio sp.]|jgi:Arabinose efflux permease|uniref:MFS transporter n=1 Tax=uncultured Ferrovibrio sp. TaxID=1576913 RepID=UPI00261F6FE1|nr:MFS transporter [uncultured Ferrovibrio sp.]
MTAKTSGSASSNFASPNSAADKPVLLRLLPFVAMVFFSFLTVGIPLPVLPAQVHGALGYGTVVVGWVIGIQSLATVLTRQPAGVTCDKYGAKSAVMLGLPAAILAGGAYLLSAVLPVSSAVSLGILFAGRLLLGVAESLFLTGAMSWAIATVGAQNTGRVMAWQGIAMYGAMGLGAPLGLWLLEQAGFIAVAVVTMAVPLPALALALLRPGIAPHQAGPRVPFYRVLGLIWQPGLALALSAMSFGALASFITLHYASRDWDGAGLALSGFGAGYILVRLFFAGLPDRHGGTIVALVSLAVQAMGQVVLFFAHSSWLAFAGATLTGLGFSLVFPALGVEAMRRVAPQSRGMAIGGYIAFFDLAIFLAGPVLGFVAAGFGYPTVFLACAIGAVLAMGLAAALRPPQL